MPLSQLILLLNLLLINICNNSNKIKNNKKHSQASSLYMMIAKNHELLIGWTWHRMGNTFGKVNPISADSMYVRNTDPFITVLTW